MRVVFSPRALRDLRDIGDFIALDDLRRAETFIFELEAACRSLSTDSFRYAPLEKPQGYRRMPVGRYLVYYQVTSTEVRIVRVVHSARDLRDTDI